MKQDDWLETAKLLQCGRTIRAQCCSNDKSQLITHDAKGYSRHCFRCGEHDWEGHGIRSLSDLHRHKAELAIMETKQVFIPSDATDRNLSSRLWLYKYGLDDDTADKYSISYSPSLDRVILPVYEDNELTAVQMRSLSRDVKPKYLNPSGPKVSKALFIAQKWTDFNAVVIVEDILSAIKVGQVHNAVSILGTNMTDSRALKLHHKYKKFIIWLDGDKAGLNGQQLAVRQLKLLGCKVAVINSTHDPKTYTREEISNYIKGAIDVN